MSMNVYKGIKDILLVNITNYINIVVIICIILFKFNFHL